MRVPGGENASAPLFGRTYVVIRRLVLHCSLDSVGQETEDGTSPQQHGETAKHLKEKKERWRRVGGCWQACGGNPTVTVPVCRT